MRKIRSLKTPPVELENSKLSGETIATMILATASTINGRYLLFNRPPSRKRVSHVAASKSARAATIHTTGVKSANAVESVSTNGNDRRLIIMNESTPLSCVSQFESAYWPFRLRQTGVKLPDA